MKLCLPIIITAVALALAPPASAQFMFVDVNGDGLNTGSDVLTPSTTSVDIWLATNQDKDGNPVSCLQGAYPLTINSYTFILTAPAGGVTYGTWTDNLGFTINVGNAQAGNDLWVGWATATPLPPGKYKLGTLALTVTGNATLDFLESTTLDVTAMTSFGSQCIGADFDNTMKYPQDWNQVAGTYAPIPVTETTWGKIKSMYR